MVWARSAAACPPDQCEVLPHPGRGGQGPALPLSVTGQPPARPPAGKTLTIGSPGRLPSVVPLASDRVPYCRRIAEKGLDTPYRRNGLI